MSKFADDQHYRKPQNSFMMDKVANDQSYRFYFTLTGIYVIILHFCNIQLE